jgi:glucose-6-phosphate 1-dehydrogenase
MSGGSTDKQTITLVILGASGDLTQRKLVPALYNVYRKGRLPEGTRVVGFARRPYDDETFRARLREGVETFAGDAFEESVWESFAERVFYVRGKLDVAAAHHRRETVRSRLGLVAGAEPADPYRFRRAPGLSD